MRSSAARTDAVNARMSPPATSSASSGRIAVRIGWARMAYGARKNTNATWYATTPPATEPPTMIAAPRSNPVFALSSAPQPESRSNRPSPAWRPSQRGRKEKPLWRAATQRIPTKAMTPPVPAIASNSRSVSVSRRVGSGPATIRKTIKAATITTVLPIGAAAVIENRRRA